LHYAQATGRDVVGETGEEVPIADQMLDYLEADHQVVAAAAEIEIQVEIDAAKSVRHGEALEAFVESQDVAVDPEVARHVGRVARQHGEDAAAAAADIEQGESWPAGGRLVLSTPSTPFVQRVARDNPRFGHVSPTQDGDHVRQGYVAEELLAMARDNGLEVTSIDWISRFDSAADVTDLLKPRSPGRLLLHNLRQPRDPALAYRIGGDPAECAEAWWSIGIACRKPG